MHGDDFMTSLRELYRKGGKYQKAAQSVQGAWGRARMTGASLDETFKGMARTNHGETRIAYCVKYDLTGFARLVTVINNNVCMFLFAGDHDASDDWLNKNRGLDFIAKSRGGKVVLEKVRVSEPEQGPEAVIEGESDLSEGPILLLLPQDKRTSILARIKPLVQGELLAVESIASDDELLELSMRCGEPQRQAAVLDVLVSLRSGDVSNAVNRIELFLEQATPIGELPESEVESIRSSDAATLLSDVDEELFRHFVETASFEKWMLYLHPAQRDLVSKDFPGAARMAGVSGSGKTCVVIHRALRLADQYASEPVLIVTLSAALARLIDRLIDAQRGKLRPMNLRVMSIFDLCFEKLMQLEPNRKDYYTKRSIAKNPHAIPEHIDEVWREYFMCENNNADADAMLEVIQSLNARRIFANDYLRQEFDYIRSTLAPADREGYLSMKREGRIFPLEEHFRRKILEGLHGWEMKMDAVGVIDDMGIVASLHKHLDAVTPQYRAIIVDESQDLGTLELAVIRRLVAEGENDLLLCGDAAQSIHTKSVDLKAAGIDTTGRAIRLNRNYRNSRQILTAAHDVLTKALQTMPRGAVSLDVIDPEYANFSSPKPLLLSAGSLEEEIARALTFLEDYANSGLANQRHCLVVAGFSGPAIEVLSERFNLPILGVKTDVQASRIFLSDLEQTKGFEFDTVVVVNCSAGVLPHPSLPAEESFRDLCRLYVAMTRAKTQLVLSYSGKPSTFIEAAAESFVNATFEEYADRSAADVSHLPEPNVPSVLDPTTWGRKGVPFIKSRDAAGMTKVVQDEIIAHVSGRELTRGRRQLEWKTFGSFVTAMQNPRARHLVVTEPTWQALSEHVDSLRQRG